MAAEKPDAEPARRGRSLPVLAAATAVAAALSAACGGGSGAGDALAEPAPTAQEAQCQALGWLPVVVNAAGLPRRALWKAPPGAWTKGVVLVMHGGGGQHANFCVANVALIEPQVRFTTLALQRGFAVFLLDSSDRVADVNSQACGKIWDDEVRPTPSLDLPFVQTLLDTTLPGLRPPGSRSEVFITGLSSGGYMAVRAATKWADRITAFAPVSSGDPYGWTRDCTPRSSDRSNVFGIAIDNTTRRPISEPGACANTSDANEQAWDNATNGDPNRTRPPWRVFHHAQDGIHDVSCVERLRRQLQARGYPQTAPFRLEGGERAAAWHYWLDDYNAPVLDFFTAQLR